MLLRIRSRDGLERVHVTGPHISISQFKTLIESQLQIPIQNQTLSADRNLLLAKTAADLHRFTDMADPSTTLSDLNLSNGSIVFLFYNGERTVRGGPAVFPAGSFGRSMTMNELIAKLNRINRQESPHCDSISFDRDTANAFQLYVNETLVFAVKRGGFLYGTISKERKIEVDFVYEPPQRGLEDDLILLRDQEEEKLVDAVAAGLGMKRVGFIFTETMTHNKKDYNFSNKEVLKAVELHAESGLKEWVTVIVKVEVAEGGANIHFEGFQLSDMCVKFFKEGLFVKEFGKNDDPKLSKMNKKVMVDMKDVKEVDNDYFLVVVEINVHQGPLSSTFPIENRNNLVTMKTLKNHLEKTKSLPFVKSISDFHLLLFLATSHDLVSDIPVLARCVITQTPVSEGHQLLIESMANSS